MDDIKKEFGETYYKLPGLHKIYLEPCGSWFPEQQKPMRFELQAPSFKRHEKDTIKMYKIIRKE